MRIVIQRVSEASVKIDGHIHGQIGKGYLILMGVCDDDTEEDADWLVKKVTALRVFDDEQGVMNRSIMDVGGDCLVVSQFTLFASYKKGNRPSWFKAARHEISVPLYDYFCRRLSQEMQRPVQTGEFGADMKVSLVNDGPVTICMDTKNKE
ncbi:MAG: D-tyrosyl-tRNA(Tyr) deacylase [Prevotella sp.]|nr:D-tyrosyl-tRNA(Tyr) deacylase [Prevotella sp.]